MQPNMQSNGASLHPLVVVTEEPTGGVTARVVGLPELSVTAATRDEALTQLRFQVQEWHVRGRLVTLEVPEGKPLPQWSVHLDPNDPMEQEYLEEIRRYREEVDLREQQEMERQACSNTSSTPTT